MRYALSYVDHRCRVERMEFDAPTDAAAVTAARRHVAVIKEIFRRDHPGVTVRRDWYVLWIVENLQTRVNVYERRTV